MPKPIYAQPHVKPSRDTVLRSRLIFCHASSRCLAPEMDRTGTAGGYATAGKPKLTLDIPKQRRRWIALEHLGLSIDFRINMTVLASKVESPTFGLPYDGLWRTKRSDQTFLISRWTTPFPVPTQRRGHS
jgi:hypothetical protein